MSPFGGADELNQRVLNVNKTRSQKTRREKQRTDNKLIL